MMSDIKEDKAVDNTADVNENNVDMKPEDDNKSLMPEQAPEQTASNIPEPPNDNKDGLLNKFMEANMYVKGIIIVGALVVVSILYDLVFGGSSTNSNQNYRDLPVARRAPMQENKVPKEVPKVEDVAAEIKDVEIKQSKVKRNKSIDSGGSLMDTKKLARIKSNKAVKYTSGSDAQKNNYTRLDLARTIPKGQVIKCKMNSYVSSNVGGRVEVIVSNDIHSLKDHNVLIPKGTRIFGMFNKMDSIQMSKMSINWDEMIFPDGYVFKMPMQSISDDGSSGDKAKWKSNAPKRIISYVTSAAADIGLNFGGAKLKNTINEKIKSALNDDIGTLRTLLNSVISAADDHNALSTILTNVTLKNQSIQESIVSYNDSTSAHTQSNVVGFLNQIISTYSVESRYVDTAVNNLSQKLQNEIDQLFGQINDYFYKSVGDDAFIVLSNSFEIPEEAITRRGIIV